MLKLKRSLLLVLGLGLGAAGGFMGTKYFAKPSKSAVDCDSYTKSHSKHKSHKSASVKKKRKNVAKAKSNIHRVSHSKAKKRANKKNNRKLRADAAELRTLDIASVQPTSARSPWIDSLSGAQAEMAMTNRDRAVAKCETTCEGNADRTISLVGVVVETNDAQLAHKGGVMGDLESGDGRSRPLAYVR
jgi:hypothetical protein